MHKPQNSPGFWATNKYSNVGQKTRASGNCQKHRKTKNNKNNENKSPPPPPKKKKIKKRLGKGAERVRNQTKSRDHLNYRIVDIGNNTEKSHEDLTRLAVTQTSVNDHQIAKIIIRVHPRSNRLN